MNLFWVIVNGGRAFCSYSRSRAREVALFLAKKTKAPAVVKGYFYEETITA